MITQGSVIRAVLDYVYIALKGQGGVTIGDAPAVETDFDEVIRLTGVGSIAEYYSDKSLRLDIIDLRAEQGQTRLGRLLVKPLKGDPLGYSVVDLKNNSELTDIKGDIKKFRVNNYDIRYMREHHDSSKNEYCIANSILNADVIINLPKLKTHNRTGITCSLKNFVGINGYKSWLPHHRAGSREDGGDEYEHRDVRKDMIIRIYDRISSTKRKYEIPPLWGCILLLNISKMVIPYKDDFFDGSWHGNDTIPRTISDLNKIVRYADKAGTLRDTPQRKMFILVDGIIAGEKEGPQSPSEKKCGILVAGYNPVEVDIVCSRIMGFDYRKMVMFRHAMGRKRYTLFEGNPRDIEIAADNCRSLDDIYDAFGCDFMPPLGWRGHIEYVREEKAKALVKVSPIASK